MNSILGYAREIGMVLIYVAVLSLFVAFILMIL
jgi:preprotein translocase subunit SecE